MKNILSFLLGVALLVLLSATIQTSNLFTIKPATPRSIVCFTYNGNKTGKNLILKYNKLGYITKIVTERDGYGNSLVVMEKY